MKFYFLSLFMLVQVVTGTAQTTAIADGNWSNTAIWSTGVVPTSGTDVIIPSGRNVTVDGATGAQGNCRDIDIQSGATLTLGTNYISPRRVLTCNGTLSASANTARIAPTGAGQVTINGNFSTLARLQVGNNVTDASLPEVVVASGANVTVAVVAFSATYWLQVDGTLTVSPQAGGANVASTLIAGTRMTINGTLNIVSTANSCTVQTAGDIDGFGVTNLTPSTTASVAYQTNASTGNITVGTLNATANTGSGSITINGSSTNPSGLMNITTLNVYGAAASSGSVNIGHATSPSTTNITTLNNEAKGTVNFNAGGTYGTISSLTMNTDLSSRILNFNKDITVNNLTLTLGRIRLNANNVVLTVNSSIIGGASSSYIYGTSSTISGVKVRCTTIPTSGMTIPLGGTRYYPITVTPNSTADMSFSVAGQIGQSGYPTSFTPAILDLTKVVQAEYVVTHNGGGVASLSFGYGASDYGAAYSATDPKGLARSTGGAWSQVSTSVGASSASVSNQSLSAGVTYYYGITAEGGLMAGVIPVELMFFKAKANGKTNLLSWATASEKDNLEFQIERSDDGQSFKNIGTVKGNGTTQTVNNYTFTDETPFSKAYYRLKQVNVDGSADYSKIISVARSSILDNYKIYPSVSQNVLTVEMQEGEDGRLIVHDLTGRQWFDQKANPSGQTQVDISKLPQGNYLLTIKINKLQVTERFVKN